MRGVIATIIVVGLAVGIWLLWPNAAVDAPPVTQAMAISSSTSSTAVPTTTTTSSVPGTTTTSETSHVVATVAEAEDILRELWFGWFEGIYDHDEQRLRQVVATRQMLKAGLTAELDFISSPSRDGISISQTEILRADADCLALWDAITVDSLGIDIPNAQLDVLRWQEGRWKLSTAWQYKDDLWEADCESVLLPLP